MPEAPARAAGEAPPAIAAASSSAVGIPSRAPARVTESQAATTARLDAGSRSRPLASPAASAPLSASPAPVASTACTVGEAMSTAGIRPTRTAPADPSEKRNACPAPGPSDVVSRSVARHGSGPRCLDVAGPTGASRRSPGGQLAAVRRHAVGEAEHRPVDPGCWGRVEHGPAPPSRPIRSASRARVRRDLVGDDDDVGRVWAQPRRAPRGPGPRLAPRSRPARRRSGSRRRCRRGSARRRSPCASSADAATVGAFGVSAASASRRELVVAQRGHEHNRRTEPCRGDRLVAALAAMGPAERAAEHRLAGLWQALRLDDEVDVDRPDDEDSTTHRAVALRHDPVMNSPPSTPITSPLIN